MNFMVFYIIQHVLLAISFVSYIKRMKLYDIWYYNIYTLSILSVYFYLNVYKCNIFLHMQKLK